MSEPPVQVTKPSACSRSRPVDRDRLCAVRPVTGFGETPLMVGAGAAGAPPETAVFDTYRPGCDSHRPIVRVGLVMIDICTCVLLRKVTRRGYRVRTARPGHKDRRLVHEARPLIVTVCALFDPSPGSAYTRDRRPGGPDRDVHATRLGAGRSVLGQKPFCTTKLKVPAVFSVAGPLSVVVVFVVSTLFGMVQGYTPCRSPGSAPPRGRNCSTDREGERPAVGALDSY